MYRNSKMRMVRRVGGNALVALVTLGSGVAIATTIAHQSHTTAATAPVATTSVAKTATPTAPASATLVSSSSAPAVRVTPVSGVVTALSGSSITIQSKTGASLTYSISASTIVLQGRVKTTLASVKVGTQVFVVPSATSPSAATAIGIVAASRGGEGSDGGSESSDGN